MWSLLVSAPSLLLLLYHLLLNKSSTKLLCTEVFSAYLLHQWEKGMTLRFLQKCRGLIFRLHFKINNAAANEWVKFTSCWYLYTGLNPRMLSELLFMYTYRMKIMPLFEIVWLVNQYCLSMEIYKKRKNNSKKMRSWLTSQQGTDS